MSEGALQDAIRLALGTLPEGAWWRNNCGVALHPNGARVVYGLAVGSADLVGVVRGRFVALEVKTPTGRVTPAQAQWLALVRAQGGVAEVVRSVEDALAVVRAITDGA